MYAIIATSGKQYRVAAGDIITVDRIKAEEGSALDLANVLLVGGDTLTIGAPIVEGAVVKATVKAHILGDKRVTFKYKARKRNRRHVGYRPRFTQLEILSIDV